MASNYTGNPTATQSPGRQPMPGETPIVAIPAGTDAPTIESITQALKENTDYVAWLMQFGRREVFQYLFDDTTQISVYNTNQNPVPGTTKMQIVLAGPGAPGGSSVEFLPPGGGGVASLATPYCGSMANCIGGAASGRVGRLVALNPVWLLGATAAQVCFEIDVAVQDITKSQPAFGLAANPAIAANSSNDIFVRWTPGNSGWSVTNNGAATTAGSLPPVNNTTQRMRFMIYGSATPYAIANSWASGGLELYVNDTRVVQFSGTLTPTTTVMYPFCEDTANSASAGSAYFSGWTITVNRI